MKCKEVRHILFLTFMVDVVLIILGYYMIPVVFNYPPYSMNVDFQNSILPVTYSQQFVILFSLAVIIHLVWTNLSLKPIIEYEKKRQLGEKFTQEYIEKIRKKCIINPLKMYMCQLVIPQILIGIFLSSLNVELSLIVKILVMVFLVVAGGGMYIYIVAKKHYDKIIARTYEISKDYDFKPSKFFTMKTLLFFQIIPLFFVGITITFLLGYTRVINEKGNSLYYYYSSQFNEKEIKQEEITLAGLKDRLASVKLKNPDDFYFIIFPNGYEYKSDESKNLSDFFKKYMVANYDKTNGRIYEYYGVEEQAFVRRFTDANGALWYTGFKYSVSDPSTLYFFFGSAFIIFLIYIIIIYIWAKNMSLNVSRIVRNLNDVIAKNRVDLNDVMPITSYDEIGSLADAYNRMQRVLSQQVELMEKQAQLATLGELAGGMAHDINTPIASIDNSIAMLKGIAETSENVKSEDLKVVISIMEKCVNRIVNIVNSMRNQIRNLGSSEKVLIDLKQVIEDSIVIVNNDIIKSNCKLITNLQSIKIQGEANKIGQVVTNLIANAAQAYKEKEKAGEIIIKTYKTETEAIIEIQDFAGGIPEPIRPYIFKNILTTKGIGGTGLGLYLAYSIVKGIYGGKINFEVDEGKGTTFIIRLPLS